MVVRVGVVGKKLEAAVTVNAGVVRACRAVCDGADCDCAGSTGADYASVAIGSAQDHWICRAGQSRLNAGARFAQVNGVGSDIAEFENPIPAKCVLNRHIPLLRVGHDELARHSQTENKLRGKNPSATIRATVVCSFRRIRCGKSGSRVDESNKRAQAGYEVGIKRASLRQRVYTSLKEIGERSGRASAEGHGQVRRLETQLVHGANIFANEINAIAASNRCRVAAKEVIRKPDAGSEAL